MLRPEVEWINGSCYRKPVLASTELDGDAVDEYDKDDDHVDDNVDNEDINRFEIEYLSKDRYKSVIKVNKIFYGLIIGKRGASKRKLESDLNVYLNLNDHDNSITVKGSDKKSIASALQRLEMIVYDARPKLTPTHFIGIPATQFKDRFNEFRQDVLRECPNQFDENLFQKENKLHITIGVMTLLDQEEKGNALRLLEECRQTVILPIIKNGPLEVEVKGLDIMNNNPNYAKVLYAKIDSPQLLQIASKVIENFISAEIMNTNKNKVDIKLHMTLLNTSYLNSEQEQVQKNSFNAEPILDKFGDFYFGKLSINELCLFKMVNDRQTNYLKEGSVTI